MSPGKNKGICMFSHLQPQQPAGVKASRQPSALPAAAVPVDTPCRPNGQPRHDLCQLCTVLPALMRQLLLILDISSTASSNAPQPMQQSQPFPACTCAHLHLHLAWVPSTPVCSIFDCGCRPSPGIHADQAVVSPLPRGLDTAWLCPRGAESPKCTNSVHMVPACPCSSGCRASSSACRVLMQLACPCATGAEHHKVHAGIPGHHRRHRQAAAPVGGLHRRGEPLLQHLHHCERLLDGVLLAPALEPSWALSA